MFTKFVGKVRCIFNFIGNNKFLDGNIVLFQYWFTLIFLQVQVSPWLKIPFLDKKIIQWTQFYQLEMF